jgi:hypothetical protein
MTSMVLWLSERREYFTTCAWAETAESYTTPHFTKCLRTSMNAQTAPPLDRYPSSSALRTNKAVFLTFGPYIFGPSVSFRDWLDNPLKSTACDERIIRTRERHRDFFRRLWSEEKEVGDVSCLYHDWSSRPS